MSEIVKKAGAEELIISLEENSPDTVKILLDQFPGVEVTVKLSVREESVVISPAPLTLTISLCLKLTSAQEK